ncbi:MAG: type VII toxin-antitoxin system MntA family adenylyltransferase antitoxin [Thermoleophilaceae bacterium]
MEQARRRAVEAALADAGVRFAYLFGSRAAGTETDASDADIAASPGRQLGLLESEALAMRLARALGVPDVDLVWLDRASLELRGHVVQEGRLLYSTDEPGGVGFEVRTRSEYFAFLPALRAAERGYSARVADRGL